MLYKQNNTEKLNMDLFRNPTAEYRGTPFWAWNAELNQEELLRQIECLKAMGFGGFHIHSRAGMATEYLSDDFMELVNACIEKGNEEGMLTWIYDEDRWPSGAAGGLVTKNSKYAQRRLYFTQTKLEDEVASPEEIEEGKRFFLAAFDICLNAEGELSNYKKIEKDQPAEGTKWYVYVEQTAKRGRCNDQPYLNTLSKEAVDEFIRVTYEAYKAACGEYFGSSIPAFFTDEPSVHAHLRLENAKEATEAALSWTVGLENIYYERYGIDLVAHLPELFWNLSEKKPSKARYLYYDCLSELFSSSYMDNISNWCEQNNVYLTGHLNGEEFLETQTKNSGDAMRAYRSMGIPGIDMLCDNVELSTAKQAQSIVHQYGREGMMSEPYGVTNWDFDFRDHKFQGDWQAAFGVTVRVPHLSWYSMKGCAKRDFPASIHYQSPWYQEYGYIEDHFARLNTVLTRGRSTAKVGVIHPIESYWLGIGPVDTSEEKLRSLEEQFAYITNQLSFGLIDFDYICEALLPDIGGVCDKHLQVGKMEYSTVIVPSCHTIRKSTLNLLKEFAGQGGTIIFCGEVPSCVDGELSDEAEQFSLDSVRIPMNGYHILRALESERFLGIRDKNGRLVNNLIHSVREDNGIYWVFMAHGKKYGCKEAVPKELLQIELKGEFIPTLFDTVSGETKRLDASYKDGKTYISISIYAYDSLLLQLEKGRADETGAEDGQTDHAGVELSLADEIEVCRENAGKTEACRENVGKTEACLRNAEEQGTGTEQVFQCIDFKQAVPYKRTEENVYLLDMARYKLDGEAYPADGESCHLDSKGAILDVETYSEDEEEILRIDAKCREKLDFQPADGLGKQPWLLQKEVISHYVSLAFTIHSDVELEGAYLAAEEAKEIWLNGQQVDTVPAGYFVDQAIFKYPLPKLQAGENTLILKAPIGKRLSLEACYLLGDFDVQVAGTYKKLTASSAEIRFGDITRQGLPFYGGNVTYETTFVAEKDCSAEIIAGNYRGALVKVILDGKPAGNIVVPPYTIQIDHITKGIHTAAFVVYGTRINTFGSLHNYNAMNTWYGPRHWYGEGEQSWGYEYKLKETGILTSPQIVLKDFEYLQSFESMKCAETHGIS